MTSHRIRLHRVFAALCITGVLACAGPSTTIEQVWRSRDVRLGSLSHVVALYVSRDGTIRRTVEDKMASKLAIAGVRAVPAYSVLTSSDLRDHEAAKAKLLAAGLDGVIAIRLVANEGSLPATSDDYWGASWPVVYDQNFTFDVVMRVETDVYSVRDNKLLWSALSRTIDPASTRSVIDQVTTLIASELTKQGIVIAQQ